MFKQIFELFKSDSLYEQALTECHEMLESDREMFNESIKSLRKSHSQHDKEIAKVIKVMPSDQVTLQRLKKKKLKLKDEISKLSSHILPDIIA